MCWRVLFSQYFRSRQRHCSSWAVHSSAHAESVHAESSSDCYPGLLTSFRVVLFARFWECACYQCQFAFYESSLFFCLLLVGFILMWQIFTRHRWLTTTRKVSHCYCPFRNLSPLKQWPGFRLVFLHSLTSAHNEKCLPYCLALPVTLASIRLHLTDTQSCPDAHTSVSWGTRLREKIFCISVQEWRAWLNALRWL